MRIRVDLGGGLRLEKLCPGSKGKSATQEVVSAGFTSDDVLNLKPGSYSVHGRYGGQPRARFSISRLTGLLSGWFGKATPDCIEEVE